MPTRNPSAPPIRSWEDGYAALRRRAGDTRGWIELDSDAPDRRWPRTTGLDVIAIAALIDEAFGRTDQVTFAGTALRWASCKQDLERKALHALDNTYRGNRDFWSCLAMMCAHLSWVGCPLPPQSAWSVLLAHLSAPRNASRERWMASVAERAQAMVTQTKVVAHAIAEGVREAAAEAARGAGKVVNSAAHGLLGGIGTPLLIGGGIVAGFYLLRSRREPAHKEP